MRKSWFNEAQIIGIINEQEAGMQTAAVCRRRGLSPATFYKLKSKYGGVEVSEAATRYDAAPEEGEDVPQDDESFDLLDQEAEEAA